MKVYAIDHNDNKIEYDVIMTFKGSNDYVIYTNNSIDSKGNLKIYSAIYDPDTGLILRNPNTKEELEEIKKAFESSII